jgi:Bacterial Ig-like domain (group 2)
MELSGLKAAKDVRRLTMFGRSCFGALGLICLVLPFSGCTATGIDAVTVTPTLTDFEGGGNVQLTAIATIGHGPGHPATYEDVTKLVTWSTPLAQVANVSASGYVTIVGYGIAPIDATIHGFTGVVSSNATVCSATPSSVTGSSAISCPAITVPTFQPRTRLSLVHGVRTAGMPGEVVQFRVMGTPRETGVQEEMTNNVTWTSTDESVAMVSKSGLVTAVGKGTATIMATLTNEDRTAVAAAAAFKVTGAGK